MEGASIEHMSRCISPDFKHGENLVLGAHVIIERDVIVGKNVKLGHRCTLKSGTRIGDNSVVDDHCITTGACLIGNNVNIRTGATISRATVIEDWSFIGPGVITNHTLHVAHGRPGVSSRPLITYIGFGSIIGSQVSILAGIYIAPHTVVGGGAVVTKDLYLSGLYVGNPLCRKKNIPGHLRVRPTWYMVGNHFAAPKALNTMIRYMPDLNTERLGMQVARYNMNR